jgi:hypothetical protein
MARVAAGSLTDGACAGAPSGWLLNKGAGWWDGNYLNTLYNHHEPPNSARYERITYHNPGWKAARSLRPGGRQRVALRWARCIRQGLRGPECSASAFDALRWRGRVVRGVLREA